MLEGCAAARDAEPEQHSGEPAGHREGEVPGPAAEQSERQQAALPEPLREHAGGQLQHPHGAAVDGTDHAHLRVAEPEGLGQNREQDVDGRGKPVLDTVCAAARGEGRLPYRVRPRFPVRLHDASRWQVIRRSCHRDTLSATIFMIRQSKES